MKKTNPNGEKRAININNRVEKLHIVYNVSPGSSASGLLIFKTDPITIPFFPKRNPAYKYLQNSGLLVKSAFI